MLSTRRVLMVGAGVLVVAGCATDSTTSELGQAGRVVEVTRRQSHLCRGRGRARP
jgi:hypothetical protein